MQPKIIQHFNSIDEVLSLLKKNVVTDEMRNLFRLDGIEYLWTAEGTLIPSITAPFVSPFLYRGQVGRYQPCLPGVFRGLTKGLVRGIGLNGLSPSDRARLFIERVRLEEFVLALFDHPASAYANEIGLRLHPIALAQHYELATDRIDLTQDHNVAAFFATNERIGNQWVPIDKGTGVIYRLHRSSFYKNLPEHLVCIGKQALPRPGEQKAYTLTLPLAYDFESLPIEVFTFQQADSCGQRLNSHFNGGSSLFPPDVMAEVANTIRSEGSISRRVAAWLLSYDKPSRELLAGSLDRFDDFFTQHADVRISERDRITLTVAQQERALAGVEDIKSTFLNGVGALAVRRAQ